jgi:bifunctional oligoribonuclease and PAP phosphatase NrnA
VRQAAFRVFSILEFPLSDLQWPFGDCRTPEPREGLAVIRDADYREALDALRKASRIILTTHVKPDADGLGSIAALRHWLIGLGKTVEVIVPTPPAGRYAFLDPDRVLRVARRDVDVASIAPPDLICTVDTCTWNQLAGMEPLVGHSGAPVLAIDHHRTQDPLADWVVSDPDAPATAVVVHGLLMEAGATIDAAIATYLFASLVGDTDWFRLPNVGPETFLLAASLVAAGAVPSSVHEHMHLSDDMAKVRLLGRAIDTLRPALGGRVMVMRLTRALFRELGTDFGDTENLINECMKVRGTRVGVMLVEADGDDVRVSFRAKPHVNVLKVAEHFGGGGHRRAAGARLKGSLDAVEARVLAEVETALDEADGGSETGGCP